MPRRGENIFKRKDGRWEGRYKVIPGPNKKAVYHSVYAHSYSEVRQKLEKKKAEAITPQQQFSQPLLFRELSEHWLKSVQINAKESTIVKYRNLLNKHILDYFGDIFVSDITTADINTFIQEKLLHGRLDGKGGLSAKSVADMVNVIKGILYYGRRMGMNIQCQNVTVPIQKDRTVLHVYKQTSSRDLQKFLIENASLRDIGILVCMYTGLRIGEICALQWENINLSEGTICVRQTMQRVQNMSAVSPRRTKIIITKPKSPSSIREIPIPDFLVDLLKPKQAEDPKAFLLTGKANEYIEPRNFQYYYKKVLENNAIPYLNFHSLRHSFATRCIESGIDAKIVSDLLGHSKVNITLDRYVHITMDMKKNSIQKLSTPISH